MSPQPSTAQTAPRSWRALIAPVALLLLLAAMTAFLEINQLVTLRQSRAWVGHSHDVIDATWALLSTVEELTSSQRAYLLAHDPAALRGFKRDRARLPSEEARLLGMVQDNPSQVARAKRVIAAAEAHTADSGATSMGDMHAAVDDLMNAERALLAERTARANRDQTISFVIGLGLSGLAILGLGGLIAQMTLANRRLAHEVGERIAAEAAQRESEACTAPSSPIPPTTCR